MKKFTNFNFGDSRMDRCWAEVGPRMDRFDSVSIVSRQSDLRTYVGRIAAILLLVLTVGVGEVWGTVQTTYNLGDLSKTSLTYEKSTSEIKLNKGEIKVEVPCADAAGTLYLNGGSKQDDRFASVWGTNGTAYDGSRQVSMTAGYGAGIAFTSSDVLTDDGKYYIIFGARYTSSYDDFKIYGFKYTLSSECGSRTFEPGEIVYIKDIKIDGDACMKISGKNIWAVFVDESGTSSDWAQGDLEKGSWDTEGAIYKMTVPARKNEGKDYIKVIFTRDDWAKQTIDLTTTEPNNLFNLSGTKSGSKFTGSWGFYTPESKTVYFDIRNVTDWMDGGKAAYVRIGHGSWNDAWGAMTKVAGTKYLYSQTTSKWDNHTMFAIANTAGWTDGKNIYQPYEEGGNIKPNDSYKMTKQTNYQKYPIISDAYICPSGTSILERGCQYYKVNSSTSTNTYDNSNRLVSLPSYTVTSTFSNCAIAMVKYTADDGSTTESLPSGGTVKPSQYVKATVTPSTGYEFSAVTLSGTENTDYTIETAAAAGTPGVYSILGDVTISAVCTPEKYDIAYKDGGATDNISFSGEHIGTAPEKHTYNTATTLKKACKAGYVFGGWYKEYSLTNNTNLSIGATEKTADFKLYAKWTAMSMVDLVSGTFYGASAMVPAGVTVGSEQYYPGVSSDQRFNLLGTGKSDATGGPMSSKTISSQSLTNASAVTECLYFKKAATVSSYIPADHAIQFKIPAAGQLEIWANDGIYLSNGSSETAISPSTNYATVTVAAGTYYLYSKNTSRTLYGIRFKATHSVSAITSTGNNTYGSVSASPTTVVEGGTSTVTAVPATGYQVTNWGVSGTGSTISPSGSSNANSTTLTMGTANAEVTVTFGAINYSVTYSAPDNGDYTIQVGAGSAGSETKTANYENTITLAADPDDGYTFSSWTIVNTSTSEDVTSTLLGDDADDADASFTMPNYGVTVTAEFEAACSGPNGSSATFSSAGYTYDQGDDANEMSLTGMAASGGGALSYQWYKTTSDVAHGEPISGATSNTYTPSTSVAHVAIWYYYCVVTEAGCATTYTTALSGAIVVNPSVCYNLTLKTDGSADTVSKGTSITTSNYAGTLTGGIATIGKSDISYSTGANGGLTLGDSKIIDVDLDYLTQVGSIITVKFYLSGSGSNYGLKINGQSKWTVSSSSGSKTISYTLTGSDTELVGQNHLTIARNAGSPVFQSITISNCSGTEAPCFTISDAAKNGSTTLSADTITNAIIDGTIRGGQVKYTGSGSYNGNDDHGIIFDNDNDELTITLWGDKALEEGSVISITQHGNSSTSKATGFKISGLSMTPATYTNSTAYEENTQTYTVPSASDLIGKQSFTIKWTGTNQVYLKSMNITGCGEVSCSAPTSAVISGGGAKYQYNAIELTASASGTDESTTYTWYRGNSGEAAAKAAGAIQATSTSGSTYTIAECSTTDAAVYYCIISNGTGCEVTASTSISVTARYYLTYDKNTTDEVSNMPDRELHTPDIYTLSSKVPTRAGYTFSCWNRNQAGTGDCFNAGASFTTGALDETLYAKWTPNDYTITYHLNGASWTSSAGVAEYTCGTGATLPLAGAMTNTGYTFDGWKDNSGLTGSSVTTIGTSEYGNKEYWAEWTENTYTVTYDKNGGSGSTMDNTVGHYVTLSANTYTNSGYVFAGWNTATDGSGASYSEGEEIELKANLDLYAIWATDYTITWDASPKLSGVDAKPNLGGGNYTITASVSAWTGSLDASMISSETSGVTITGVSVDNSANPKTITATFNVGASVVGDKISFTLDVPADGSFSAKSDTEDFDIDRCTGSSSGSDGVLFSAEFKDSGLGASDICTAANTAYTFTTAELKAAATGGSIKASTTSTLSHMKFATNAISIAGSDGVIQIDLSNAIATNDLFTYVNVNSSSSSAYLRHTSADNTTDQIALTVYNSKEAKVRLTSGFNEKTTLYIVRNSGDFKLHKAAVVRPAFLMLLRDDTPTSTTNLSGTDQELTTENYLTTINGGSAYYTSPSSGNLQIIQNSSKNYIKFSNTAGYVKIVLTDALQEGDVIGFDAHNTDNLALTVTAERSTSITTTNQLYTVGSSSPLKDQTTFYLWQNSGSGNNLRGLQIARSGVAGGSSGTDKITTTLTWSPAVSSDGDWSTDHLAKETGDADFTFTASQDKNSLGAITYSSSNTSVATVNASGKVHIAGAGNATITATMAASGCYKEATVSYNITVTDNCADDAGTISTEDLGCSGVKLTVTGHTTSGKTVSYQWYKDGGAIGGATSDNYTATTAGEYYVVVTNTGDGHCAKASTNTITLEARAAATASKIVNSWYVKNGRRTPDIALVQTENATNFTVTSGGSPITTFAGCAFYLGTDGIIYLKGQQEDGSAPTGLTSGDETLKFIATACGGNSSELSITIHKQESTTLPSVAFVVDGTKGGDFDEEEENHSVNTELYQYLDYGADETGAFDLTGQNVYSTVDEQAIREHYSQFDAILITDDPSTDTKSGKKSYVDAFGTMIDVRPILTMEAFVSKWGNWKAKGIDGNPESPNPRQYKMKLQCKDHAIFKDLSVGTNVETETIDGVEYWTVTMVDNTKSPYSGVADGTDTDTKPALQGFSADDVSSLLLLGEISGGSLYAGVERQEETAARLMLLGLNAKALPNALTPEGKKVIENALEYLIETDLEKVDDCSNYFTGETDEDWNKDSNWSKNHVPNSPNVRVRILSECVIYSGTYKVAEVDIATSGKSLNKDGEMTGKLTINAGAALIVGGKIRTAEAPYFNTGDLKPTTVNDLIINTSSTAQAGLVFNNDAGDTKATVNLYSLGRKADGYYQFQYYAVPMTYIDVNPAFAGSGIYTYVWKEATGWERRGYYAGLEAFEGVGITTKFADAKTYTMKGTLASTETKEITLTKETDGYNLIGNSWTAPIQISKLEEDNSSLSNKTVYIYNAGNDTVGGGTEGSSAGQWTAIPFDASGFSGWSGMKVIPAMQAFELVPTSEETLKLDYAKVVRGDNKTLTEPLHAPNRNADHAGIELMRIRVADSNTHTDLHLFEGEQFSEEFDNGWEAAYLDGDDGTTKLYADVTLGRMAVVATNELEGTILGFAPGQELEYTFSFGGAGMGYYLNDLKLKTSTLINAENSYTFTFEEGDTNRFYISSTPIDAPQTPTGVDNTHSGEVKAQKFIYNDKMYIMINGRVYSAEGALVK